MRHTARMTAAAAALLVASTMGLSTAAFAADPQTTVDGTSQAATNPALINPDASVQLSIHKYLGEVTNQTANGTELSSFDRPALQGVKFKIFKVTDVDLKTNKGWETATALQGADLSRVTASGGSIAVGNSTFTLTEAGESTTNADGLATLAPAQGVGLYVVVEDLAGSGRITEDGSTTDIKNTLTASMPFLVTLPMTDPAKTSSWMYDVHVYPKNQKDSITKELVDKQSLTTDPDGSATNNEITYTISTSITDGDTATNPLNSYAVYDNLDPALTLKGISLALSNESELKFGEDYQAYANTDGATSATPYTQDTTVSGGPTVAIVFTEAGLKKLEAVRNATSADSAKPVEVVTTIKAIGTMDADGIIPNTASFIPNKAWWDLHMKPTDNPNTPPSDTPGIPSNEVVSKYGDVVIDKYDPANSGADMTGATFAIYWDPTPGDTTCSLADVTGQTAIATGSIDNTGKTAADTGYNQLTFTGLQTSNWYNNAAVTDEAKYLSYCLVETKAPEGYNLDATAHYVTIDYTTADAGTSSATGAKAAFTTEKVANEQSNLGNKLPLTGGEGVALFSVAGLVLIGGGLGYYAWTQRRRKDA